ncbi:hypothetical protein [Sinosporangium siamense]|uniref:Secreted protein n=1 Tax=Sinosporangium siamense TaxID=1367973 RepID=A0A919RHB5_9ACTN|nr:hypothetical protein [Sinosporangium siamense]GII92399.1 hypothetical protein Ssi02_26300 [Sinosporangium siamense]
MTIILVALLFMLIIGGVAIYAMVRLGKVAAKKAREATSKFTTHVNAMGTGEAAEVERMRIDLQREISITRQAVDRAIHEGWGLGDLPQLVGEISQHANVLDGQLAAYAQQRRVSPYVDHVTLGRLREHHGKLTSTCARIRADLLDNQVAHSSTGIGELHTRTEMEIEARRQAGTPVADPLDEIEDLYQRTIAAEKPHRPDELR